MIAIITSFFSWLLFPAKRIICVEVNQFLDDNAMSLRICALLEF